MGLGIRHYIFPENSEPLRIADRVATGLVHGRDSLPQFANTKQRILLVVLETDERKPISIDHYSSPIWVFDDDGDITESNMESLRLVMEVVAGRLAKKDNVVSLRSEQSRKKLQENFRWEPTNEQIARVERDIWPKKREDRLKFAEGTAKRTIPPTWEAQQVFEEFEKGVSMVNYRLSNLKEPSLKSFVSEANKRAKDDPDIRPLYRGLAELADEKLTILKQRSRNKGTWYAVVKVMHVNDSIYETISRYHERCTSRDAAEKAAQRLLADHAKDFRLNVVIEAELLTELEWQWECQFMPESERAN